MALITYNQLKEVLTDFKTKIKATFVEDIAYDVITNKLSKTKNGNTEVIIDHVVENWGDLEHTKYAPIQNIFDKTKAEQDKHYTPIAGQIGTILDNTDYVVGYVPCLAGEQFTIIKGATHDSRQAGVFNSQRQCIHNMNLSYRTVKGKQVYNVEIPSNLADAAFFAFNMHKVHTNPNDVMVFKGILSDDEIPIKYYPNLGNYTAVVDGDKVAIEFNKDSTSLQSNTVVEAIKELANRANTGGGGTVTSVNNVQPQGGNVTIDSTNINTTATNQTVQQALDNKVETSRVGNNAGQIPQIDGTGKLATSIIPDLAITSVQVVNEKTDAQNLVTSNSIQVGDVVVIANDNNSVYMYNGTSQATFDANFIELSLGEGTIKVINNQRPDATGSLTLNGTQINVNGQSNTTIQQEFDKCVKLVNGQAPTLNGEVTVNAAQINAFVGNQVKNVQQHMQDMNTNITNNANKIAALERKHPTYNVGDIVPTFKDSGNGYVIDGCQFMYCGTQHLLTRANYPEFATVLGIPSGTSAFNTPVIANETIRYDNSARQAIKRYYVCVKNN